MSNSCDQIQMSNSRDHIYVILEGVRNHPILIHCIYVSQSLHHTSSNDSLLNSDFYFSKPDHGIFVPFEKVVMAYT